MARGHMRVLDRFVLDDRVAVVTGGSRGLGFAMTRALNEAGARVAVISRNESEACAAAMECSEHNRGYGVDVSDASAVSSAVARIVEDFGRIDILVNNAGTNAVAPIEMLSVEEFRAVQE